MTDGQIEKTAAAYVLKRMVARNSAKSETKSALCDFDLRRQMWDGFDMEQAYADGMCEANLALCWVNACDTLPESGLIVLVFSEDKSGNLCGYGLAYYDGEEWYNVESHKQIHPIYWMDFPNAPKQNS